MRWRHSHGAVAKRPWSIPCIILTAAGTGLQTIKNRHLIVSRIYSSPGASSKVGRMSQVPLREGDVSSSEREAQLTASPQAIHADHRSSFSRPLLPLLDRDSSLVKKSPIKQVLPHHAAQKGMGRVEQRRDPPFAFDKDGDVGRCQLGDEALRPGAEVEKAVEWLFKLQRACLCLYRRNRLSVTSGYLISRDTHSFAAVRARTPPCGLFCTHTRMASRRMPRRLWPLPSLLQGRKPLRADRSERELLGRWSSGINRLRYYCHHAHGTAEA